MCSPNCSLRASTVFSPGGFVPVDKRAHITRARQGARFDGYKVRRSAGCEWTVVQPDRRSLIVRCHDPQKVLIDVLRCVGDAGGVVAGVQVTPATLQSAFLAVTGREFEGA
ncbi:hypothetical protein [Streptomyces sp. NPDC127119]|uniref:hypothetical protein n=1 Tax=Streptomyces sp. NPDC127119 TaxID=3345370 RepID=UPI0036434AB3